MSDDPVFAAARPSVLDRDLRSCLRCDEPATDVHHRCARGMGGSSDPRTHDLANLVSLCRPCHSWAHSRPLEAAVDGYIVVRGDDPAGVPVLWHGQMANLTSRGTILIPAKTGHGRE